jgi:hypothetical protein
VPTDSPNSVEFVEDLKRGIADVLSRASSRIVIVCPYVRLEEVPSIASRIEDALERGVEVTLIVRDEGKQVREALGSREHSLHASGLNLLAVKDLHAKIYMSDSQLIVSSVNLLGSSFQKGLEVGLSVPPGPLRDRVLDFIELDLLDHAREVLGRKPHLRRQLPPPQPRQPLTASITPLDDSKVAALQVPIAAPPPPAAKEAIDAQAHCIRCATQIPLDLGHPFCKKDQRTWAKYGDEQYPEVYCLLCGREKATTKAKPMCRSCYKKFTAAATP